MHSWIAIADLRNDWWTNHYFRGHPARSDRNTLHLEDPRCPHLPDLNTALVQTTRREEDFNWTLNQTEIWAARPAGADGLRLAFKTVTPNFEHFEIVTDGGRVVSRSLVFAWQLHPGENTLTVRSVNKFGVGGIPSTARLTP
jgi:hypothetical protein